MVLGHLPFSLLVNGSGSRVLPLFYHKAHLENPPYFRRGYTVKTPEQFAADIDFLCSRLTPIHIADFLGMKSGGELPHGSFFLSFDDGYRELAEIIAPILLKKGVPATFFICSDIIDNADWIFEDQIGLALHRFYALEPKRQDACIEYCLKPYGLSIEALSNIRERSAEVLAKLGDFLDLDWKAQLRKFSPYLTSAQISNLKNQGFGIGAHGIDHTVFNRMTIEEQVLQISESSGLISRRFDLPYRVFAFPYGDFEVSRQLFNTVKEENIVDCMFGTRGLIEDEYQPFVYQRLWCENHEGPFKDYLKSNLASKMLRHLRGRDIVRRRQ